MRIRLQITSILGTLFLFTICFYTNLLSVQAEKATPTGVTEQSSQTATGQVKKTTKKYPIFVESNLPAGVYSKAITIKLTASNPDAQIWYSCKLNSSPGDLLKYEKPIILSQSCALVFFAFTDYQNESKIERKNYTIIYSNDVKLETNNGILSLKNSGTGTVDIGNWGIIAGTGAITIPPGTTLTPDSAYSIGKVDPKSYELKSPEGFLKDSIQVVPSVIKRNIAQSSIPKTKIKTEYIPPATSGNLLQSNSGTSQEADNIPLVSEGVSTLTGELAPVQVPEYPVPTTEKTTLENSGTTQENIKQNILENQEKNPKIAQDSPVYKANVVETKTDISQYGWIVIFGIFVLGIAGYINRKQS